MGTVKITVTFSCQTSTKSKMASGTLYTYQGSFRANKILIASAYSGANVTVDPNFEYGKTNTSAEFLKKFPLGKVPAFESNGTYLSESDAIAQFVSNEALLGGGCRSAQAAVREYISFTENEILPSACTWVYPTLGFKQYNKQDTEKSQQHIKACLDKLNKDLLTKTFLVGERITLADITLCTTLVMLYIQVLEPKFRDSYPNVNRWFITCVNQPNFKKVLGDVKLCEKMAVFDNKRYQELHPKGGKDKKEQKPKAEKKEQKKSKKNHKRKMKSLQLNQNQKKKRLLIISHTFQNLRNLILTIGKGVTQMTIILIVWTYFWIHLIQIHTVYGMESKGFTITSLKIINSNFLPVMLSTVFYNELNHCANTLLV